MNILILGGNRFVGKALAKHSMKWHKVDVFNRSGTGPDGVGIIKGDRNNTEDLNEVEWDKYDTIVDMCLFFPQQWKLVSPLIPRDTNYIFVSSGAADSRYRSAYGAYGEDKKAVEVMLEEEQAILRNYKIVRPSYIVGKGNHRPRIGYYMNKLIHMEHIEIAGDGKNIVNIVFVEDVVKQLFRLVNTLEKTYEKLEVVGDNIEMIDLVHKVFKYVLDDAYQGSVMLVQDDENAILPKNDFEFETDLDYIKLDKGLKDYAEWYYNEGAKKYGYVI